MTFQIGDKVTVRTGYQTPRLRVGHTFTVSCAFSENGNDYVTIAELDTDYFAHRFELVRRETVKAPVTTCTTSRIQQMYDLNKKRKQLCASL